MRPEESKLFLIDLLKVRYPVLSVDIMTQMSGLLYGVLNSNGHCIWVTEDEFTEFGNKITRLK